MTTSANGRAERKSLASQLDRLDGILDGLADGLNEAVATAVKQAVVVAVEAAVRELLASAELQHRLHPEPANKPGLVRRAAIALCRGLRSVVKGCWPGITVLVGRCRARSADAVLRMQGRQAVVMDQVRRSMTAFGRRVWLGGFIVAGVARRWRKPLLVATAVGTALAVACYLAGPAVGPLANGIAGFLGALSVGMLARLRSLVGRLADRARDLSRAP